MEDVLQRRHGQNHRICINGCYPTTFYGAFGERLGTFRWTNSYIIQFTMATETLHFAGRLIESDGKWRATGRLGSLRADSAGGRCRYYPYGRKAGCQRLIHVRWRWEAGPEQYFQETTYYCSAKNRGYRIQVTGLCTRH